MPGGTGNPALVISARPDPLPPSRSFIVRSPSAFPSPKKYTYFPFEVRGPEVRAADFFAARPALEPAALVDLVFLPANFFAIACRLLRLRNDFRNICQIQNQVAEVGHERQTRGPDPR